jgi:pimeloyl-ACP methyl ester carboxylesterase
VATATVPSADGTVIGYHTVGLGPPLIVVGGALRAAEDYLALAHALAERYSVHVVDRRGRGLSGPQGPRYGIARECEDLLAVKAGLRHLNLLRRFRRLSPKALGRPSNRGKTKRGA